MGPSLGFKKSHSGIRALSHQNDFFLSCNPVQMMVTNCWQEHAFAKLLVCMFGAAGAKLPVPNFAVQSPSLCLRPLLVP